MSNVDSTRLKLQCADGSFVDVPKDSFMKMSEVVKDLVEELGAEDAYPMPGVANAQVLQKIAEFVAKHVDDAPIPEEEANIIPEMQEWDKVWGECARTDFSAYPYDKDIYETVPPSSEQLKHLFRFDVIKSASYLAMKPCVDIIKRIIASDQQCKTPEEIRIMYGFKPLTEQELAEIEAEDGEWLRSM